jgi:hypothetical protein
MNDGMGGRGDAHSASLKSGLVRRRHEWGWGPLLIQGPIRGGQVHAEEHATRLHMGKAHEMNRRHSLAVSVRDTSSLAASRTPIIGGR